MEQSLFPRALWKPSGEWDLVSQDGRDLKLLPIAAYLVGRENRDGVYLAEHFRLYHLVNG